MSRKKTENRAEVVKDITSIMFNDGQPHAATARAIWESTGGGLAAAAAAKARALANHASQARSTSVVFVGRN